MTPVPDLTLRRFLAGLSIVLVLATALRAAYPTADPPWQTSVGITWHDEGAWVHNARNKVLWGAWSTDRWNPMYLTPVFSALEYAAFEALGVGQWQARTVSAGMGLLAIVFVAFGAAACANRRAGLVAAALFASNYAWVQWNRAALMEATMVAFIAISWSAYALAGRRPVWGAAAGIAAVLAFFTKAAAAFYVAAIGIEALLALGVARGVWPPGAAAGTRPAGRLERPSDTAAPALWTLGGLAVAGAAFLLFFVLPYWPEFRFYNWEMSVTRKPVYGLGAFVDRASWVPIVNNFFTRMWPVTLLALAGGFGLLARWRSARPAERLLGLWLVLGVAEVIVHDAGNERRLIFFIPVLIVLAALVLARGDAVLPATVVHIPRRTALLALPLALYAAYIACGAIVRTAFLPEVRPSVWGAAAAAVLVTGFVYVTWPRGVAWLSRRPCSPAGAALVVVLVVGGDLVQFWLWAASRTYKNVEASRLVGEWLPAGTLVQGKLANGLALENRIKPIFVGRGFGNYDDRLRRDDVRYLLTYVTPRLGYEGTVLNDLLTGCPGWRILRTFDVAETATGHDRAALILKAPRCTPDVPRSPIAKD